MIELRSDTFTQPTARMRAAMAAAVLGDDVYGEDPTVVELERLSADVVGKAAACLMPSGTMANLAALMTHARRGEKVVLGSETDLYLYEAGGAAVCGGLVYAPVANLPDGTLAPDQLAENCAWDPDDPQLARPAVICLENTHSRCGGTALEPAYLERLRRQADEWQLLVHLDGARLFNAALATGTSPADLAASVDSVQFCLSKGLSAPVGSMLCGSAEFIEGARRVRKMLGGGMRQAGVVAAAGIVALQDMVCRLGDDHRNARRLATGLAELPGVEVDPAPQTNIVMFRVRTASMSQREFMHRLAERDVRLAELGRGRIRAVTHAGLSEADVDRALEHMSDVLGAR